MSDRPQKQRETPMPTSTAFAARVYGVVARIPRGRVTTYGRIARALGEPRSVRMGGWANGSTRSQRKAEVARVSSR